MSKSHNSLFSPRVYVPRSGSRALEKYLSSWKEINQFVSFVLVSVSHIDRNAEIAHQTLLTSPNEKTRLNTEETWKSRVSAKESLRANRQFFVEIILVRHIENYLSYLASLLYEIFVQRPETLKSSEKIEVSVALQCDSIETLVREIAEKKVESLSYSSFSDLYMFFDDRFGLKLASEEQLKLLLEAIEIRNISVHNRCHINKRYISRLKLDSENIGKLKQLGIEDLEKLIPMLIEMAISADKQARSKLHLTGFRFSKQAQT